MSKGMDDAWSHFTKWQSRQRHTFQWKAFSTRKCLKRQCFSTFNSSSQITGKYQHVALNSVQMPNSVLLFQMESGVISSKKNCYEGGWVTRQSNESFGWKSYNQKAQRVCQKGHSCGIFKSNEKQVKDRAVMFVCLPFPCWKDWSLAVWVTAGFCSPEFCVFCPPAPPDNNLMFISSITPRQFYRFKSPGTSQSLFCKASVLYICQINI